MTRSAPALSFVSVVLGGTVGWIAVFAGLGLWALPLAAGLSIMVMLGLARLARSRPPLSLMLAYGPAFALLTWPILWLVVGLVNYAITGQTLGD